MSTAKGNGLGATNVQPAKTHTKHTFKSTAFTGTSNPRHLRVIAALISRPQLRESIDNVAGCSNGPELIAELRRRGLRIPCPRLNFLDRDGYNCRPGVYHLTNADRRKINQWKAKRLEGTAK